VLAGNLFAAAGFGSAITAVLIGRLTDRIGRFTLVLVLACFATALLYVPQYWVSSVNQLYVLRGLVGLTIGGMLATASTLLSLSTPRERRGAAIGLSAGVNAAGQAVGQLGGSALATAFGIRSVFLFTAGVLGAVTVVAGLGLKEPRAGGPDEDETPAPSPPGTVSTVVTSRL
jgi:MFS family permease